MKPSYQMQPPPKDSPLPAKGNQQGVVKRPPPGPPGSPSSSRYTNRAAPGSKVLPSKLGVIEEELVKKETESPAEAIYVDGDSNNNIVTISHGRTDISVSGADSDSDWGGGQWDDFSTSIIGNEDGQYDDVKFSTYLNKRISQPYNCDPGKDVNNGGSNNSDDPQNNYLHQPPEDFDVRALEIWVKKRRMAKKYLVADEFYRMRVTFYRKRSLFDAWRKYSWGFIGLRNELLKYFIMNFLQRRLYAWRNIAKREKILLKYVKKHWRRKLMLSWNLWNKSTAYEKNKNELMIFGFAKFKLRCNFMKKIYSKWFNIRVKYYKHHINLVIDVEKVAMARVIQRIFRWHRPRRKFWAMKTIKNYLMRYFGLHILHRRKMYEKERSRCELENINFIVNKMYSDFEIVLESGPGKILLKSFEENVDKALKGGLENVFPPPKVLPGINKMWTNAGRRSLCLKHECIRRATLLARSKFRLLAPPIYDCNFCSRVTLTKKLRNFHRENCLERQNYLLIPQHSTSDRKRQVATTSSKQSQFVERESIYKCFVYSRLLIEEALQSSVNLISSYIKPLITKNQTKARKRMSKRQDFITKEEDRGKTTMEQIIRDKNSSSQQGNESQQPLRSGQDKMIEVKESKVVQAPATPAAPIVDVANNYPANTTTTELSVTLTPVNMIETAILSNKSESAMPIGVNGQSNDAIKLLDSNIPPYSSDKKNSNSCGDNMDILGREEDEESKSRKERKKRRKSKKEKKEKGKEAGESSDNRQEAGANRGGVGSSVRMNLVSAIRGALSWGARFKSSFTSNTSPPPRSNSSSNISDGSSSSPNSQNTTSFSSKSLSPQFSVQNSSNMSPNFDIDPFNSPRTIRNRLSLQLELAGALSDTLASSLLTTNSADEKLANIDAQEAENRAPRAEKVNFGSANDSMRESDMYPISNSKANNNVTTYPDPDPDPDHDLDTRFLRKNDGIGIIEAKNESKTEKSSLALKELQDATTSVLSTERNLNMYTSDNEKYSSLPETNNVQSINNSALKLKDKDEIVDKILPTFLPNIVRVTPLSSPGSGLSRSVSLLDTSNELSHTIGRKSKKDEDVIMIVKKDTNNISPERPPRKVDLLNLERADRERLFKREVSLRQSKKDVQKLESFFSDKCDFPAPLCIRLAEALVVDFKLHSVRRLIKARNDGSLSGIYQTLQLEGEDISIIETELASIVWETELAAIVREYSN